MTGKITPHILRAIADCIWYLPIQLTSSTGAAAAEKGYSILNFPMQIFLR